MSYSNLRLKGMERRPLLHVDVLSGKPFFREGRPASDPGRGLVTVCLNDIKLPSLIGSRDESWSKPISRLMRA